MNLRIAGGELYVAEYWNDRIQVFGLDGTPKRIIGGVRVRARAPLVRMPQAHRPP